MPIGPGKYDDLATSVRRAAKAKTVIVMVIGGDRGSGFSVQTESPTAAHALPALLRDMAKQIDRSLQEGRL